jgi:hypothetical protein
MMCGLVSPFAYSDDRHCQELGPTAGPHIDARTTIVEWAWQLPSARPTKCRTDAVTSSDFGPAAALRVADQYPLIN